MNLCDIISALEEFKELRENLEFLLYKMEGLENLDGIKELGEQVNDLLAQIKKMRGASKIDQTKFKAQLEKNVSECFREFEEIYDTLPGCELY